MKTTTFPIVILAALLARAPLAIGVPQEAAPEPTATIAPTPSSPDTPGPTPVVISIDDHSQYSACNGEISEVAFSCACETPAAKLRKLSLKERDRAKKAGMRGKKNFNACLRRGIFEDTRRGSSCGNPEGLRSWCERYHTGQQNCCAAECVENQARYCCQRHCGRGRFKTF